MFISSPYISHYQTHLKMCKPLPSGLWPLVLARYLGASPSLPFGSNCHWPGLEDRPRGSSHWIASFGLGHGSGSFLLLWCSFRGTETSLFWLSPWLRTCFYSYTPSPSLKVGYVLFGFNPDERRVVPKDISLVLHVMKHRIWIARNDFRFHGIQQSFHDNLHSVFCLPPFFPGTLSKNVSKVWAPTAPLQSSMASPWSPWVPLRRWLYHLQTQVSISIFLLVFFSWHLL